MDHGVGKLLYWLFKQSEGANLVKVCIKKLHDADVSVTSLTCDGPICHFSMKSAHGASLDPLKMQSFFPISWAQKEGTYFLDVCHILNLIRNTLGIKGIFLDKDGDEIYWQYVTELQKLQEKGPNAGKQVKSCTHKVETAKNES